MALCRRFSVRRMDVFGSAVAGGFDPARSDIDLIVEFDAAEDPLRQYFGLKSELESLLNCPVDVIEASAVRNPYLTSSIERSRETIHAT